MNATVMNKDTTNKATIKQIVRAIRANENKANTAILDYLAAQIEIGEQLLKLKKAVGHGGWAAALQELEYDERKAQRLMNFPGSGIDQIRTNDTDLVRELPQDLIKLESLAKLTPAQLREAFAVNGWYFEEMTRPQLAEAVKAVQAGKPPMIVTSTGEDEAGSKSDKHPKQQHVAHAHVAHKQLKRAGDDQAENYEAGDEAAAEDQEVDAAGSNVGDEPTEMAADSGLAHAVDAAAQELYERVLEAAQKHVQEPEFVVFSEQGHQADNLLQAILGRLCKLLTGQQRTAAN